MLYLYIGAIVVSEALAYFALKHYSLERNPLMFALGVLCYAIVCYCLVRTFAYKDIGIVNVIWSIVSVVAIISVGVAFFHESVSWKEAAGVGFALVSLILLGGR
ncbi:MAG TPA: SMR family transporter [Candidatus Baltobacteraceae bacterium]|nr:SMR family transporter [Candidatus Baltobacteraceae bacterium]